MEVIDPQEFAFERNQEAESNLKAAHDLAVQTAFEYAKKSLQELLDIIERGCTMTHLTASIQSHLEKLKEEELLVSSQLRLDLGTEKLKKLLMKGRMAEIGLNPQQIGYVMSEKPESIYLDFSPSMKEKPHFSDKFYQVLDKLNIAKPAEAQDMAPEEISKRIRDSLEKHCLEASPVRERMQNLNHTLQYLNEENIRLRAELAQRNPEELTESINNVLKELEQEEHLEHQKLGIMSQEYEKKIARIKAEDLEIFRHLKDRVNTLSQRVHKLRDKLRESSGQIQELQAVIKARDDQLNKEYIEHGMMLEKANQEVRQLTKLLEAAKNKEDPNLRGSQTTTTSNPLKPYPPLHLMPSNRGQSSENILGPRVSELNRMNASTGSQIIDPATLPRVMRGVDSKRTSRQGSGIQPDSAITSVLDNALEYQRQEIEHDHELLASMAIRQQINENLRKAMEEKALVEHQELLRLRGELQTAKIALQAHHAAARQDSMQAEMQVYLNQIGQLSATIGRLEAQLEIQAGELRELRDFKARLSTREQMLEARLQVLERAEQESKPQAIQHQSEINHLRELLRSTSLKADEAANNLKREVERARDAREMVAHKTDEVAQLKEKITQLESLPRGVPQPEVRKHLFMISELTKRASEAESKLQDQMRRFEALKSEEESHRAEIESLNQKLAQVQSEEAKTKAEVKLRDDKIDAFKKLLASSNNRLQALAKENIKLADENKRDMKMLNDSIQETNRHLLQIGILSQLVQQLEKDQHDYLAHVDQPEISEYIGKISELRISLEKAESDLIKKNQSLAQLQSKEEQAEKQIEGLTKKLSALKEEEDKIQEENSQKEAQVGYLKKSLDQALTKLADEHKKLVRDEVDLDQLGTDQSYLKEEVERRGVTIQNLERGVIMLEQVIESDKKIEEKLKRAIEEKDAELDRITKEENELKKHMSALIKKCDLLESANQSEKKTAEETEKLANEYKKLYEQANHRLEELSLKRQETEKALKDAQEEPAVKSMKERQNLQEKFSNLETIMTGMPLEQATERVRQLQIAKNQLQEAEARRQKTEEELHSALSAEGDAVKTVVRLADKVKQLEMDTFIVEDLEKKAHEQEVLKLKAMLLTATERMRDLSMQNKELKALHKNDEADVQRGISQTNRLLEEMKGLTDRLQSSEADKETAANKVKEYQANIEQLQKKLDEAEKVRAQREKSLKELEEQDKQHQDYIAQILGKMVEKAASDSGDQDLLEKKDKEIAELKSKLNQTLSGIHKFIGRSKSIEEGTDPSEAMRRLEEQNQAYMARISLLNKRIFSLLAHQKKLEEGPLTSRISSMNQIIKDLESKNENLMARLERLNKELESKSQAEKPPSESQAEKLAASVADMKDELEYLRSLPRGVPEDVIEEVRIKNSELQARIRTLEAALKERDIPTLFAESPARRLTKQIDALGHRIKELQSEKEAGLDVPFEKEKELATLTKLFEELKGKLEEAINYEPPFKKLTTQGSFKEAAILKDDPSQDKYESMKDKIARLEAASPRMKEGDQYGDKLAKMKELNQRLMEDELLISKQATELGKLRSHSDKLMTTLIVLTEKIASLEREEQLEEEFIKEGTQEIASLKDALKETVGHLKEVSDKNFELEQQHKEDRERMSQTIAKMNTNLIGIAVLASNLKQFEHEREEEANRYLDLINQLNADIIATEKRLNERTEALNITKEADEEHQAQILRLSARISELEEQERKLIEKDEGINSQLADIKEQLAEARSLIDVNDQKKEWLRNALIQEVTRMKGFDEETDRFANALHRLNKDLPKLKVANSPENLAKIKRYISKIGCIIKMLEDTEDALLDKTSETITGEDTQEVPEDRDFQELADRHTQLLRNKIEQLESKESPTQESLQEKTLELEFYKELLKQATDKLGSHLDQPLKVPDYRVHKSLPHKVPPSLEDSDKELVEEYLTLVRRLDNQMSVRDELLKKEADRLTKLRDTKSKHSAQIQKLWHQLKELQSKKNVAPEHREQQDSKAIVLKLTLDEVTKKLEDLIRENDELREQHRQEMAELDHVIQKSSKDFMKMAAMEDRLKDLEATLQSQNQEHEARERMLKKALDEREAQLKAKIDTLSIVESEDKDHENEVNTLMNRIYDLEELDREHYDLLKQKMDEVDTLRNVLKDTIRLLESQQEEKDKIRDKVTGAREMIEAQLRDEHDKVEEKDAQIQELKHAVDILASDAVKLSQEESKAKSIIETLTKKIKDLEAEKETNKEKLDQEEGELDMYKLMLVDWRKKLVQQTHINEVMKNKIIEEGQLLALKASMWPASQFTLLLSEIKSLENMPSMIQNVDLSQSVTDINHLLTELIQDEEHFMGIYGRLNKFMKEEKHIMRDALGKILECASPSNQDSRCVKIAIGDSKDAIDTLKKRSERIDSHKEELNISCSKILTILDKISVNLANIALILESAQAEDQRQGEGSHELDSYVQAVNNLSHKIERVAGNFEEAVNDARHRLASSSHSVLLIPVQEILSQFVAIEDFNEHTPRPGASISDPKRKADFQNIIDQANEVKARLDEEERALPRTIELIGILSQRIIFLEEERRAQQKIAIKEKVEILRLLLKASTIMSVHAKTEVLDESDIDELTSATSTLANSFLEDQVGSQHEEFLKNLESLVMIARKLDSKTKKSMGLNGLINRVVADLEKLETISTKHGGILVQDLLEQAIKLNELHISCCIEAAMNPVVAISTQDENLEARAWDAKKIQELEGTIEALREVLANKDHQVKQANHKIVELTHLIRQLKSEKLLGQKARVAHYNDQIMVMRHRIRDLEDQLHKALGSANLGDIGGQSQHHVFAHNDALIRRLHEADNTIHALTESNHHQAAQIEELNRKLDSLGLTPNERIVLEDRIVKLEGELALSRSQSQIVEARLQERIHQLLKSVFLLRIQLLRKHGRALGSPESGKSQTELPRGLGSFAPIQSSKLPEFQPEISTTLGRPGFQPRAGVDRQ